MWKSFLLTMAAAFFISSCMQAISSEVRSLADKDLSFQQIVQNPEAYRGKIVLIGGRIIGTYVEEGKTWLEVLQQPLGWRDKPESSDVSYGRFLIYFPEYKDPEVFRKNDLVTVAGEIKEASKRRINSVQYRYPVLVPRELNIWQPGESGTPRFHFGIGIGGVIR
ncbi:MAG: Slp family lipoprotein [Syntrophales bacterium]|jgi:outer membrane lipoprotein|nr:Slp family lipoprotein [Syntrophales bacterium]MDY0045149.1 Slp family lipoprotein [Syntrophales bacterium]